MSTSLQKAARDPKDETFRSLASELPSSQAKPRLGQHSSLRGGTRFGEL